jgi:hypothetical protein
MGKPTFASSFSVKFENNGGDEDYLYATAVCPYCKHINKISYDTKSGSLCCDVQCEHLTRYSSPILGFKCDFEFSSTPAEVKHG